MHMQYKTNPDSFFFFLGWAVRGCNESLLVGSAKEISEKSCTEEAVMLTEEARYCLPFEYSRCPVRKVMGHHVT